MLMYAMDGRLRTVPAVAWVNQESDEPGVECGPDKWHDLPADSRGDCGPLNVAMG